MDKYKVKMNPKAVRDIDQIYEYRAMEKLSPENAKGQADQIKDAILNYNRSISGEKYMKLTCNIFSKNGRINSGLFAFPV